MPIESSAGCEAVNRTRVADDDTPDIAADDEDATSLAEEIGAGSQTPAA